MEVRLNRNSWHTSLYRWTHGKEPRFWSLCPYFWTIVWCLITAPIVFIYKKIESIWPEKKARVVKPEPKKTATQHKKDAAQLKKDALRKAAIDRALGIFGIALLVTPLLFALVMGFQKQGWVFFLNILLVAFIIAVLILTVIGSLWIWSKFERSDIWNAIEGMGNAWWNKVCPAIEWQDESTKTN
jgi:heme/copper-type cytochrome/quinol oxidase subunit 4